LILCGELNVKLQFRNLLLSDAGWLTGLVNDPEAAKYLLSVYPVTQHEVIEFLKKDLESSETKHIVAELDGKPVGTVSLWWRTVGRDRHVAWLGIDVKTKQWGKGIGSALMQEAVRVAKELGFRKMVLGVFEGNERAMRLYTKSGFKNEACEKDEVWIDGSWRNGLLMGLELAPCKPRLKSSQIKHNTRKQYSARVANISARQLEDNDLDEVNRLQNCTHSTKSSFRVPPVTKEQTKQWYEGIKAQENKYCFASFSNNRLVGYLLFRALALPFTCLKFEEIIVDANQKPYEAAAVLVGTVKDFKERYRYHRVSAFVPETNDPITSALENQGFKKTGAMKDYYFIDGHYVNAAVYGYL
jgi:RimJ/RimL family protein N-acetyltransferase